MPHRTDISQAMRALVVIVALAVGAWGQDGPVGRVCGKLELGIKASPREAFDYSFKSVKHASVKLYREGNDTPIAAAKTSRWGNFRFPKVPDGKYAIVVDTENGLSFRAPIRVDSKIETVCLEETYRIVDGKLTRWETITLD